MMLGLYYYMIVYIEGLEQQRAICILAILRKLALKIFCCTVHIQIVRQYFWWYSTVEHLHQWALLLVGSWCSKDHFDTKTSFWPKMQIALCCSDPSMYCLKHPLCMLSKCLCMCIMFFFYYDALGHIFSACSGLTSYI